MHRTIRAPRRLLAVATTAALIVGASLVAVTPAHAAPAPAIADPKLELCVENALDALNLGCLGGVLNDLTLGLLSSLSCVGKGIIDVTGLQNVGGLSTLDLRDNQITDIGVLSTLTSVGNLKLDGNGLLDLSALKDVHGLLFTPLDITALDQERTLAPVTAGVAQAIPFIKDVDGNLIMPTVSTLGGAVTGVLDSVNRTVTWTGDGVGKLVWAVGDFAGTLTTVVSSLSTPAYPVDTPVISGSAVVGGTLSASGGADLQYQWYRHDGSTVTTISGATGAGYSPVVADLGTTLTVKATGAGDGYTTTIKESAPTDAIATGTVPVSPVPTVSGAASVGSTLTATVGTWTSGTALAYRWVRTSSGAPHDIPGATGTTYKPVAADLGSRITFRVSGTSPGYATPRTSAPTAVVVPAAAPGGGTGGGGAGGVGTGSGTGTGTGTGTGATSDNASIGGGSGGGASIATSASAAVTTAALKKFAKTTKPRIVGTAKAGRVLTAKVATWTKGVKYSYQWKANGKKIAKATHKKYTVTAKNAGKRITVTVTGKLAGYRSVAKVSKATARVAQ